MENILGLRFNMISLVIIIFLSHVQYGLSQNYEVNAIGYSDILRADRLVVEGNKEEGFKLMKKTADLGNSDAMYVVAIYYLYGVGVEPDESMYKKYLRASFEKNNQTAIYLIVSEHWDKFRWLISEEQLEEKLLNLASDDDSIFKYFLGKFYSKRASNKEDNSFFEKALFWHEKYANSNEAKFSNVLEAGEYIIEMFLKLSGKGLKNLDSSLENRMESIFLRAQDLYQDSWGFSINVILARYYQKKENEIESYYIFYEDETYVPNYEKAKKFYLRALENRDSGSKFFYYMFTKEYLEKTNVAKEILLKGMETDCVECQIEFALYYEDSPERIHELLVEAMGFEEGFLNFYSSVKSFFNSANEFSIISSYRHDTYKKAALRLASNYYLGKGVGVDKGEALKWLIKVKEVYGDDSYDETLRELGYFN